MPGIDQISMFSIRIFGWDYKGWGNATITVTISTFMTTTTLHIETKIESNSEALNFPAECRYFIIASILSFFVRDVVGISA